jgi:CBS domain containing-hemolysin-like protein
LVTLEDLIETLLGDEIVDETDKVVDLQERARQIKRQLPSE